MEKRVLRFENAKPNFMESHALNQGSSKIGFCTYRCRNCVIVENHKYIRHNVTSTNNTGY
jgi:hypothetical protein